MRYSLDINLLHLLVESKFLENKGYSVWWDRKIPPGRTFDDVIEEAINASKCMIVVWSKKSVSSNWVRTEAGEGDEKGILIPIMIDEVVIPLAFRRIEAAQLMDWDGSSNHPEIDVLLESVGKLIGISSDNATPSADILIPREKKNEAGRKRIAFQESLTKGQNIFREISLWAIGGMLGGAIGGGVIWLLVYLRSSDLVIFWHEIIVSAPISGGVLGALAGFVLGFTLSISSFDVWWKQIFISSIGTALGVIFVYQIGMQFLFKETFFYFGAPFGMTVAGLIYFLRNQKYHKRF